MPLYVIRPPNPQVGADWTATVPGQYLYDIRGITADLATTAGGASVALDASGNARNGTYHGGNNTGWFQPGIVAGDLSFLTGTIPAGSKFWFESPYAAVQWAGSWSFACWVKVPPIPPTMAPVLMDAFVGPSNPGARVQLNAGPDGALQVDSQNDTWVTAAGVVPTNGTACFIAVTWDGATLVAYIDGAAVAWASHVHFPGVDPPNLPPTMGTANGSTSNTQINIDEWTVWDTPLLAGQIAAIYAAALTSFVAYTAAVLGSAPAIYYHLDDGALNTGRQVTFQVTNGSDTVALIPSGFPISSSVGSFVYSWQPKLGASAQTAGGTTTTVAIPQLVLPAGYTLGSHTLDLGAGDQWSEINIWWDSTLMDAINPANQWDFPPGFKLLYQQDVNAPVGGRVIF